MQKKEKRSVFEIDSDTLQHEANLSGVPLNWNFEFFCLKQPQRQENKDPNIFQKLGPHQEVHRNSQLQFEDDRTKYWQLSKLNELHKQLEKKYNKNSKLCFKVEINQIKTEVSQVNKNNCKSTKNILPNFKKFHFGLIKDNTGKLIYSDDELQRIRKSKNITMLDYQYIYSIEQLRPIFDMAFKRKVIYRYLMRSRVKNQLKKFYLSKIQVFEKAFRQRVFDRINY